MKPTKVQENGKVCRQQWITFHVQTQLHWNEQRKTETKPSIENKNKNPKWNERPGWGSDGKMCGIYSSNEYTYANFPSLNWMRCYLFTSFDFDFCCRTFSRLLVCILLFVQIYSIHLLFIFHLFSFSLTHFYPLSLTHTHIYIYSHIQLNSISLSRSKSFTHKFMNITHSRVQR